MVFDAYGDTGQRHVHSDRPELTTQTIGRGVMIDHALRRPCNVHWQGIDTACTRGKRGAELKHQQQRFFVVHRAIGVRANRPLPIWWKKLAWLGLHNDAGRR